MAYRFHDVYDHTMWPFCHYCQSRPVRFPADHIQAWVSPWSIFPVAGSVDGKWKGWFDPCIFSVQLASNADLNSGKEVRVMPFPSKESIQNLPGSRFCGFMYHPDSSLLPMGKFSLITAAAIGAPPPRLIVLWSPSATSEQHGFYSLALTLTFFLVRIYIYHGWKVFQIVSCSSV